MIFRRPDAFIMKHIKIIHAFMLLCMVYLLTRTSLISSLYERVNDTKNIIGESNLENIFGNYTFISTIILIIFSVIILLLVIKKEGKYFFYIITTIVFSAMLVFYIMSYKNIELLERELLDFRIIKAYGDISNILFIIQGIFAFLFLFKATGFDIKTFGFGNNVLGVEIDAEDSEEVELNLEIDRNELKTVKRKKIRDLKIKYFENRFKINLIILGIVLIIAGFVYYKIKNNKIIYYSNNTELLSYSYDATIGDVIVTNLSYKNEKIDNKAYFAILNIKLKKNISQEYKFNSTNIYLIINNDKYYPTNDYDDYFQDLGVIYNNQKLSKEYNDYILIYKIPYEFSKTDMYAILNSNYDYSENKYNSYHLKLEYQKIDLNLDNNYYKLGEDMTFKANGEEYLFNINEVKFASKFKINYDYETPNKKYNLVEYIVPKAADNEEKVIMKFKCDACQNINKVFYKYGAIEYEINNDKKIAKIYDQLLPQNIKDDKTYYFQVSKDVLNGLNKKIKIQIRNNVYYYDLENVGD